ncbi:S8 family serine peptidase [Streptomyces thermodiastaticus]|uniref:S8 family serine peptidase n=1 Tax=Streptomyces thermodiastaticus TaxID=44061 RepID=UPI00167B7CD0|nr:S8 family serine peptidase [Streptomyces thermodiastaticus]MCE7548752.1 S8 family serine peptidase [Streptomyces thermodiastaticus]GHF72487.1 peptidase [Streptomyces thermodiastaticus]
MSAGPVGRGTTLLAGTLVLALLPAGTGRAAAEATTAAAEAVRATAPARAGQAPGAARTVTLVTGDKVTVTGLGGGKTTVTVRRPRGAAGAVRTRTVNGDISVVPDEALPYLRAGTLDRRLFDVSALIRQGLTDEETGELPLIVTYKDGRGVTAAPAPPGTRRVRSLPSVRGAAVTAGKGRAVWQALTAGTDVDAVWLDARVHAGLARSNAQIGTPTAWQSGLTGKGVTIAVLDTGVDATHPDLEGRIAAARSFVDGEDVADRNGHGTHVTSIVGGSGAASGGTERGVAPEATLAVGKVLDDQGNGSESQIIAGMEWAAREVGARIVSMSLSTTEPSDGTDPMARAVDTLTRETGTLFVAAAGNTGAPSSIGSPGAADAALTVGAVDSADRAASFTSAGPRAGDNALKPDLAAPGTDVLAARSQLTEGSGYYTTMSGTSMAAPQVAGVAALLAQQHPGWSGARLKDALMSTSKQLDDSAYRLGAGRVSVPGAVNARITATGSADLGFYSWPPEADTPVTRTLTYTNSSGEDVRLHLTVTGMPDGVVTLADTALTVPAHGSASTTVTGDAARAPAGTSSGQIVAADASGTPVAHTVVGLVREDERYTLTVHVTGRDGTAVPADVTVQRLAEGADPVTAHAGDDGTLHLRLEPGTYSLACFLPVHGSHGADSLGLGFLAAPEVVVDRDRGITLDGRRLREIRADVHRRTETRQLLMEYDRTAGGVDVSEAVQVPQLYDSVFAAPTGTVTQGGFEYRTVWRLGEPLLQVEGIGEAVVQAGGTLPEGRSTLPLVDVGTGDLTGRDVRGAAVLARLADGTEPSALAQAVQDAGAKALFVTDDTPGRLTAWWGTADGDRPLPIASVNATDAARLRAAHRVVMTGTPTTPYVYDLAHSHRGGVPDRDLTYAPGTRELARIQVTFHARTPVECGEFRYSVTGTFPVGIGFQESLPCPAERTDYVSTGPGQLWHESVTAGAGTWEQRGGLVRYTGGSRPALHWFRPVWHPWLGTALNTGPQRFGNDLRFEVPGWGDSGPDHTGYGDTFSPDSGMTQATALDLDGEPVYQGSGPYVYVTGAPADEHTWRLVTDTALDAARWGIATLGHTEWTFRSAAAPADAPATLPLINLAYGLPTDLAGDVRAGRRIPVTLDARYVAGATDTGTIGHGALEVSYDDGATWRAVRLTGERGHWSGTLTVPQGAAAVSLRAVARDDRGGSVRQEIVRAAGVRQGP